ncbi:hypothetical protein AMJ47_00070 [Parcubacteria bacterium DG_72]|nr:MAG: hypothetical protein AMJ47_00070 [Parcubacteria bacterium DG_72]
MNPEKWKKLSFAEQMGNIGSEFFRMVNLKQKGDVENSKDSFLRFLDLIDLTITQRKNVELLRLREVVCDLFLGENIYRVSIGSLKRYFLQFALLANK